MTRSRIVAVMTPPLSAGRPLTPQLEIPFAQTTGPVS